MNLEDILKEFDKTQHLMDLDEQDKQTIRAFISQAFKAGYDSAKKFGLEWANEKIEAAYENGQQKGMRMVVEEATRLSDEIELQSPTSSLEEWKAFKKFRNNLRDLLNPQGETNL
jgi:hypothetical protein